MRILQLYSPSGILVPLDTECTTILPTPKISANSGVDHGCPPSPCGFSAAIDPILRSVPAENCSRYDTGAMLFAYLDDWYLWIKPQCLLPTFALITPATRSANLSNLSTPKYRSGGPLARTQFLLSYKTRSDSHSAALGGASPTSLRHRTQPCCTGRAGLHGKNNTTLAENCHYTCRPQR